MTYKELIEMLNVMTVAELVELLNDVDKTTRVCFLDAIAKYYEMKVEIRDEIEERI